MKEYVQKSPGGIMAGQRRGMILQTTGELGLKLDDDDDNAGDISHFGSFQSAGWFRLIIFAQT